MRVLRGFLSLAALVVASAAGVVVAQEEAAPPGVGELTEPTEAAAFGFDSAVGFSRIAEDSFIDTNIGFTFALGKLEVGIGVPLRFRVIDEDPQDDGVFRSEDWDEVSDWLRILRFVQYGTRRDTIYVRAGELTNVTLGHGTVVDGYSNIVDVNHFQWGINAAFNLAPGGVELLLDNVVDPELFAMRPYVRPWGFFDPESYWYNLAFGITLAVDADAPRELLRDDQRLYVFDSEDNFVVEESEATVVLGADMELQAVTTDVVSVTPYVDVTFHLGQGSGFQVGNLANFTFTEWFQLNSRIEFRALSEGYEPSYFDRLYEIERFLFRSLDPKLEVIEVAPPPSRVGWYGDLTLAFLSQVFLTAGFEDYEGDDNSVFFAQLSLPQLGPVRFGAYFVNQNFDGVGEMFDFDNALFVSEARVNVQGPFYVLAQFARRWAAQPDGTYEPVDDWGVGVGVNFGF